MRGCGHLGKVCACGGGDLGVVPDIDFNPASNPSRFSIRARGPADMLDAGYISQARNDGVEFRRVRIGA